MSDIFNGQTPETDSEAQRRAERINKIRNSVHSAQEESEVPAPAAPVQEEQWENEIAARLAKRVQKVKEQKAASAEDILRELDSAEKPAAPEKVPLYSPPPAEIPVPEPVKAAETQEEIPARPAAHEQELPVREAVPQQAPKSSKGKKKKKKKKKTVKERLLGLFPRKGDSIGERIRKIVFLGSVAAIIVCGYMVSDYYLDLWKSRKLNDRVMDMYWTYQDEDVQPSTVEVENENGEVEVKQYYTLLSGARKLLDMNGEVVGVISIPDTKVNNPIMQADDNDKYLDRKINGDESRAGEIFLDFRNHFDDVGKDGFLRVPNSDNLVIYGHNMGDETMFGTLKYYERNSDYYGEHPVIDINSNYMTYKYKIFAFFILDSDDESETKFDCWNKLNFTDEKDFYDFVNEAKRRTIRLNDVDVKYGDKLVTLSTCNTLLGDRGRLIVMGRLVREGEDPLSGTQNSRANPNIKWPTMYYNTKTNEHYDPDAEFEPYGP